MPAEELSRLIDRELGHQRRPPGAARPEPEALPDQRASSTSWVALHLAAAMERASGRKAPLPHPRSLRSSVAMVLGWVLVGVLVGVLACASVNMLLGPSNVHVVVGSSNQEEARSATAPQPEKAPEARTGAAVPRGGWPSHSNIIWMLWAQGLDNLKSQAKKKGSKYAVDQTCVRAWMRLYPGPESGWEVRVLDNAEAKLLSPRYAAVRNHPKSEWIWIAAASDLLRADLLSRYGGVWVDTSVCPFQALDAWLPAALDAREGLFIPRAFDHEAIRLVLAGGETRGVLSDMPAAAMTGSELEQFEGCLYEPRWSGLVKAAKPMSSWFMAAAAPHDSIIDAWVEILYRRLLEAEELEVTRSHPRGSRPEGRGDMSSKHALRMSLKTKKTYPYFIAHCSMTTARLRDAAVEERWQRIRASAAEHGLPDPTGLGSTPCECAHRTELGCDPGFAEAHCYFVKKAKKKDFQAYLRSPRYQEHLDRLAAASAGALAEDDLASATGEAAAAPAARGEAASAP